LAFTVFAGNVQQIESISETLTLLSVGCVISGNCRNLQVPRGRRESAKARRREGAKARKHEGAKARRHEGAKARRREGAKDSLNCNLSETFCILCGTENRRQCPKRDLYSSLYDTEIKQPPITSVNKQKLVKTSEISKQKHSICGRA
jgi:hypothetical protein